MSTGRDSRRDRGPRHPTRHSGPHKTYCRLADVVPREGFVWCGHQHILLRAGLDKKVRSAMRENGSPVLFGTDPTATNIISKLVIRRPEVTSLLVQMLDNMRKSFRRLHGMKDKAAPSTTFTDGTTDFQSFEIDLTSAIMLTQARTSWLVSLSKDVIFHLVSEIIMARKRFFDLSTTDRRGRGITGEANHASRLQTSVDSLTKALEGYYDRENMSEGLARSDKGVRPVDEEAVAGDGAAEDKEYDVEMDEEEEYEYDG